MTDFAGLRDIMRERRVRALGREIITWRRPLRRGRDGVDANGLTKPLARWLAEVGVSRPAGWLQLLVDDRCHHSVETDLTAARLRSRCCCRSQRKGI